MGKFLDDEYGRPIKESIGYIPKGRFLDEDKPEKDIINERRYAEAQQEAKYAKEQPFKAGLKALTNSALKTAKTEFNPENYVTDSRKQVKRFGLIPEYTRELSNYEAQNPLITGAKSLGLQTAVTANKELNPYETFRRDPKENAKRGLELAQFAGMTFMPSAASAKLAQMGLKGISKFAPYMASGLTTTPLTEYGIAKIEGLNSEQAKERAKAAGVMDIATAGLLGAISKLRKPAATLANIPQEVTDIAINAEREGNSVFKDRNYEELARKMQEGISKPKKEIGAKIGEFKQKLSLDKTLNNIDDIKNYLNDEINLNYAKGIGSSLDKTDLKNINEIKNLVEKNPNQNAKQMMVLKDKIDNLIKKSYVSGNRTNGERILENVRNDLTKKINKNSNILETANSEYSNIKSLQKDTENLLGVINSHKDKQKYPLSVISNKLEKKFLRYLKEKSAGFETSALRPELEQISPEAVKEFEKGAAKKFYHNYLTNAGKYFGGGAALTAPFAYGAGYGMQSIPTYLGVLAAQSPKFHKLLVKASNPIFSTISKSTAKELINKLTRAHTNRNMVKEGE